jgi:hypothetical protein
MAHKHNRRRVRRPRSQNISAHSSLTNRRSLDHFIISQPGITSEASAPDLYHTDSTTNLSRPTTDATTRRRSDIPAKLWQNRYTAWQERDRAEKEHAAKLEAQQIQLFGGEPGDDVELCYKMLEYFGALDYIS